MIKIELDNKEINYLCKATFIPNNYRNLFFNNEEKQVFIKLSEKVADDLRDLCGERLQIVGFDQDYNLTYEGEILESLIDKFFIR